MLARLVHLRIAASKTSLRWCFFSTAATPSLPSHTHNVQIVYLPLAAGQVWKPQKEITDSELVNALEELTQRTSPAKASALSTPPRIDGHYLGFLLQRIYAISQTLPPNDVGKVLIACHRVGFANNATWETLCHRIKDVCHEFHHDILIEILFVSRDRTLVNGLIVMQLLQQVLTQLPTFNNRNLAMVFNAIAQNEINDDEVTTALFREITSKIQFFDSQDVLITLQAMEKLKVNNKTLSTTIVRHLQTLPRQFDLVLSALRVVMRHDPSNEAVVLQLCDDLFINPDSLTERDLVMLFDIAPVMNTIGGESSPLKQIVLNKMSNFGSGALACLLNSLAKNRIRDKLLTTQVCEELRKKLPELGNRQFNLVFCALVELRIGDQDNEFLQSLCSYGLEISTGFHHRELAEVFHALSKLQAHNKDVFVNALCTQAFSIADTFDPYTVSRTLNALASLSIPDKPLITRLCKQAIILTPNFQTRHIPIAFSALRKLEGQLEERDMTLVALLCARTLQLKDFLHPPQVGEIVFALAKLNVYDKELIPLLLEKAKTMNFNTQGIYHVLFALAVFKDRELDQTLLGKLTMHARSLKFFPEHIPYVLQALSQLLPFVDSIFVKHLCTQMSAHLLGNPKEIELIFSSLKNMGIYDEMLIFRLCQKTSLHISSLTSNQIANILDALAVFGVFHIGLITGLCEQLMRMSEIKLQSNDHQVSPKDLSFALSALTRFGEQAQTLQKRLHDHILSSLSTFDPNEFALQLQACVLPDDEEIMTRLCMQALEHLHEFKLPDIFFSLRALVKKHQFIHEPNYNLVVQLCKQALRIQEQKNDKFIPSDIALVILVIMTFKINDKAILLQWCQRATAQVSEFGCGDIGSLLFSFARLDHYDAVLVNGLCKQMLSTNTFMPRDSSAALYGLATLRVYNYPLVLKLCEHLRQVDGEFTPPMITEILVGLATFGLDDKTLITKLCREILRQVPDFNFREIISILHALLMLRHYNLEVFQSLQNSRTLINADYSAVKEEGYQCNLALSLEQPTWELLPEKLAQRPPVRRSFFHDQVSQMLSAMKIDFSTNVDVNGLVSPFALSKQRIALQIATPNDVFRDTNRPIGSVQMQHRLLQKQGWKVVFVSWFEWASLRSLQDRVKFFRTRLAGWYGKR